MLDNGVYHDFNIEKEDSLQSDFRETLDGGKANKNEQLQKLEKMILQQEDKNNKLSSNVDISDQGITKGSTKETLKEEASIEPIGK